MKIRKSFVFEIDVEKLKKHMRETYGDTNISDDDILEYTNDCTVADIVDNLLSEEEKSWVLDFSSEYDKIIEK